MVTYPGNLSGGLSATLSSPEELEGWFIHEILKRLLEKGKQTPESASQNAAAIFDSQGPFLAARFFLPGHDDLRARVRANTETAAAQIFRLIEMGHFTIRSVEQGYELPLPSLGFTLEGRPDLVLGPEPAVIDFKRGGVNFRKAELVDGVSVQLAVYGRLLSDGKKKQFPPAAYFMLKAGQLITSDQETFPEATLIEGSPLAETWQAVSQAYQTIRAELDQGDIQIPGNQDDAPQKSEIIDGRLCLKPCAFCTFGVLCGQAFMEAE